MKNIWHRSELIQLLSLSGTLSGLCITGVTLFHSHGKSVLSLTIADDGLAMSAILFLLCCYTIFFSLRTNNDRLSRILENISDVILFMALTGMVASGIIMAYTVW